MPGQPSIITDPDDMIGEIPDVDFAIAEFNSVPAKAQPFRDTPTILLRIVKGPNLSGPEPNWDALLYFFSVTSMAPLGLANLQDFYLLVVRVIIPKQTIINRKYMHEAYAQLKDLPVQCRVRYDGWGDTIGGQTDPASIPVTPSNLPAGAPTPNLALSMYIAPRTIFRSRPTPNGLQFCKWLRTRPLELTPGAGVPSKIAHRVSELDHHLAYSEIQLRALNMEQLLRRTIRALNIFWWLAQNNDRLSRYKANQWVGITAEL